MPLRNRSPAVERMVPSPVVKVGTARAPDGWNAKVYELPCARESVSGVSEGESGATAARVSQEDRAIFVQGEAKAVDFRRRLFPHIAPVPFLRLIAGDRLFPLRIVDDKPVFIDIVLRPLVLRRLAKAVVGERGVFDVHHQARLVVRMAGARAVDVCALRPVLGGVLRMKGFLPGIAAVGGLRQDGVSLSFLASAQSCSKASAASERI